jgi:hypothetical protein
MEASIIFPQADTLVEESGEAFTPAEVSTESAGLAQEVIDDALATEVEEKTFEGEEGEEFTHVITRYGESIGAAAVYFRGVPISEGKVLKAAEIELVATSEANDHSAYLALVCHIIASDPQIKVIDGIPGDKMAKIASELSYLLPPRWNCEYKLSPKSRTTEVTTYEAIDMLDGVATGDSVEHSFKKIQSV